MLVTQCVHMPSDMASCMPPREKGVNCVDYFTGGDRPYLVSGADDNQVKVWDYQTKQCVQTMEGHSHNVATVCCHPELPIIMSGSEDGCIKIWHSTTYRLENTLNYAFERCWSIAALKGTNNVAIGYDEGTIAIQLGNEVRHRHDAHRRKRRARTLPRLAPAPPRRSREPARP